MNLVFADTSFYVAISNPRDTVHAQAAAFSVQFRGRIITTEFVLNEVGNWMSKTGDRQVFVALVRQLHSDPLTTIVPASHILFDRGLGLYAMRNDKNWSLTDCITFTVMQEHGIRDALTADHHFRQAGFAALLIP